MPPSNPVLLPLPPDVWTPAAINVLSGFIHIVNGFDDFIYYQTYRLTTETAPDDLILPGDPDFEGAVIYNRQDRIAGQTVFLGGAKFAFVSGVDIYVFPQSVSNTTNTIGKIRMDQGA